MLWHWRAVAGATSSVKDWREATIKSFGPTYSDVVEAIQLKNGDFVVNRSTVGKLDKNALLRLRVIAENRHRSFEWLDDQSTPWDDVSTDT